jgi:hypothetical protein
MAHDRKNEDRYGFVYIWRDRKRNMYYIGSHWGYEDDGYICSSNPMRNAYNKRTEDFKRRIVSRIFSNRKDLLDEEQRWMDMIDPSRTLRSCKGCKTKAKYYNQNLSVNKGFWHSDPERVKEIGPVIAKKNTGKKRGPCSADKARNISEAKLAKRPDVDFEKVKELFAQNTSLPDVCLRLGTTKSHIRVLLKSHGYTSAKELKPKKEKRIPMTKEEQAALSSERLKSLWADPAWAANQSRCLRETEKVRPPRSEESKMAARLAQLGKPKSRSVSIPN